MEPTEPDYSFIMNASQGQANNTASSGRGKTRRIMIAVIGGAILVASFAAIFSFLLGNDSNIVTQRLKVTQQHSEIIRVSEIGASKARSPQARNLASTTRLTFKSSEKDVLGIVSKDQKASTKGTGTTKDDAIDTRLTEAEQNNRFDEVFVEELRALLLSYRNQLEVTFNESTSRSEKEILNDVFDQVTALLQE